MHGRSETHLAVEGHGTAVRGHDPEHLRETEPTSLPRLPRREEGLERPIANRLVHPDAGVRNGEADVRSDARSGGSLGGLGVDVHVGDPYLDATSLRHRVSRIRA